MPTPTASQSAPIFKRTVSTNSHSILIELADECVCPISQSLMVDPVIAGDGHTYDRTQIEAWFREQQSKGQIPPKSPQTREPIENTHLVSNLALRRTIERLIDSGRLDADIVADWQQAREASKLRATHEKREQSLAHAPIGTKIVVSVCLLPLQRPEVEGGFLDGSLALGEMSVDVHVASSSGGGGGLFGSRPTAGRVLVANVPIGKVMHCIEPCKSGEADDRAEKVPTMIRRLLEVPTLLPPPMPADTLLSSVLPADEGYGGSVTLALEHVVRRLASIENGLPESVQTEWNILDTELQRRRRRDQLSELRLLLSNECLNIVSVVQAVDDSGAFTLSFPGLARTQASEEQAIGSEAPVEEVTAQVPSEFIGPGGVVAQSAQPTRRTGTLFGGAPGAVNTGGGLFGANTGGGLFGAVAGGGLFGGGGLFDDED